MPTLAEPFPPAPFTSFPPDAFPFFRELTANNNRDWFLANKTRYEATVLAPVASLAADLSARLAKAKLPLRAEPKKTMFRVHRDVRFFKDKSPYKTHAGAVLSRDGETLIPRTSLPMAALIFRPPRRRHASLAFAACQFARSALGLAGYRSSRNSALTTRSARKVRKSSRSSHQATRTRLASR